MDDVNQFLADLEQFNTTSLSSELQRHATQQSQRTSSGVASSGGGTQGGADNDQEAERKKKKKIKREIKREREEDGDDDELGPVARPTQVPAGVAASAPQRGQAGGARPEAMRSWTCPLCTLQNDPFAQQCVACEWSPQSWVCARCCAVNAAAEAPRCVGCRKKRRVREDIRVPAALGDPAAAAAAAAAAATVDVTPGAAVASSSSGGGGVKQEVKQEVKVKLEDGHGDDDVDTGDGGLQPPEADAPDANDDAHAVDAGDENGVQDDEEEEEDEEDDTSSDESEDEEEEEEAAKKRGGGLQATAVREFFMSLKTVDYATLVESPSPQSMVLNGELKSFQLQALSWLVDRERGNVEAWEKKKAERRQMSGEQREIAELVRRNILNTNVNKRRNSNSNGDQDDDDDDDPDVDVALKPRGGIFADYMGLGKTRTLVALCESAKPPRVDQMRYSKVMSTSTLIVCPVSLIAQWMREINTCVLPRPRILRYYGKNRGKSLFAVAQQFDYVITSYQTLANDFLEGDVTRCKLNMIYWHRVILDEAHYIRNSKSKQSKGAINLVAERKWAVTGTPVQNRLDDMYPLLKFLEVPHFKIRSWWTANVCAPLTDSRGDDDRARGALQVLLSSLLLRRLPTSKINNVPILDLPPKKIETVELDLSPEERDFYDAVYKNAVVKLDTIVRRNTQMNSYATAFEMLMRCRQACLHPYLVVAALQRKRERNNGRNSMNGRAMDAAVEARSSVVVHAEVDKFLKEMKKKLERTAGGFGRNVLEEIQSNAESLKDKECIVCLDTLQEPAVIPCGHMFCHQCIMNCLAAATGSRCPLCKKPTKRADVNKLPQELFQEPEAPGEGPELHEIKVGEADEWMESSRVTALLKAIEATPPDEKIIVFSYFLSFLKFVQRVLERKGIITSLFSGSLTAKKRDDVIQYFCTNQGNKTCKVRQEGAPRVLLATITTCGVGINLTAASRCYIMDPSWNPGVEEQAMNRIHRIGQTKPVTITKFFARNTVEERIEDLAVEKRQMSEVCVDSAGVIPSAGARPAKARLGKEELFRMFARDDRKEAEEAQRQLQAQQQRRNNAATQQQNPPRQ